MTPSQWAEAVAATSISDIAGLEDLNIEEGQIGAIRGINAFSHW